jgi:CRISPR-associated protein Cas4
MNIRLNLKIAVLSGPMAWMRASVTLACRLPRQRWDCMARWIELIPVEWKHTERSEVMQHHRYQLAMYALLAEERFAKPVTRCFVYLIPLKHAREVPILDGMRRYARRAAAELRDMLLTERMPAPTNRRRRCVDCEFRRFCNDIESPKGEQGEEGVDSASL